MRQTWTETYYALTAEDIPLISQHDDSVSFHLPGDRGGAGFCLQLTPAHLPAVRQLLEALEQVPQKEWQPRGLRP